VSIIAVDFDGTVCRHEFPEVGADVPGAVTTLLFLASMGHSLILYTIRSGRFLDDAKKWFEINKIPLAGVQYAPGQSEWTSSNKCYAQIYIDDAALGAPLVYPKVGRPYFDWEAATLPLIKLLSEGDRNPIVGGGVVK